MSRGVRSIAAKPAELKRPLPAPRERSTPAWKRAYDLLLFFVAAAVFALPGLLIAAAILLDDGRPLFFGQERLGLRRRRFRVLKFRSMRDGRVTRAGRWLRRTGLDELPQFLNILRGDMSFVGPRPLTEDDVRRLGWTGRRQDFRWALKPGITGEAQIRAGTGARDSLARDRLYLPRMSPLRDTCILGITFAMNILGKSRVKRWLTGRIRVS